MPRVKFIVKLSVSAALVAWLVTRLDLRGTWQMLSRVHLLELSPIIVIGLCGIVLSAWKWTCILRHLGIALSFAQSLRLFWIGIFFNNFLPGRTGGDLVRAIGLAKHAQNPFSAAISVAIDRGLNLIALIAIGLVAFLLAGMPLSLKLDVSRLGMLAAIVFGIGVLASLALVLKNRVSVLQNLWEKTTRAGRILWHSPAHLILFLGLAGFYQMSMILAHVIVAHILKIEISILHFFYLIPITAMVTLLPISLNGIGVRESAFALAFSQAGVTVELAVTLSVIITVCTLLLSLIGGFFYATGLSTDRSVAYTPIRGEASSCP